MGANRQWRPIHAREKVPAQRANCAVPSKHSLYPLRLNVFHNQFFGRARSCDTKATIRMSSTEYVVERANQIHRVIARGLVSFQERQKIGRKHMGGIIAWRLYDFQG